jgi:prophage maintenance system killer protein
MSSSGSPMSEERFADGHYVVTLIDAHTAHARISRPNENPDVLLPEQLAGALARPYCGFFPELYEKAAALMESLAGSQVFVTANKRTAIALVDLLVRNSGYRLYPADDSERVTVASEQLSKAVGRHDMKLEAVTEWYRLRLRRFVT